MFLPSAMWTLYYFYLFYGDFAIPVVANHMRSLGAYVYFSTNTYILVSKKIGLALLVEFGANTLASFVFFAIPIVANHMRSLGAQSVDRNGRVN